MEGWALIEYGGEWEDSWEKILTVYLNVEKAIKRKEELIRSLENDKEQLRRCESCNNITCSFEAESMDKFEKMKERAECSCKRADIHFDEECSGYYYGYCSNDLTCLYGNDVCGYKITSVEVDNDK